jgi:hypothetical protein
MQWMAVTTGDAHQFHIKKRFCQLDTTAALLKVTDLKTGTRRIKSDLGHKAKAQHNSILPPMSSAGLLLHGLSQCSPAIIKRTKLNGQEIILDQKG